MLDSITIKNYKAIQSEQGLTLSGLTNVNYLVGKNGCGKSSVLEKVQEKINSLNIKNPNWFVRKLSEWWIILLSIIIIVPISFTLNSEVQQIIVVLYFFVLFSLPLVYTIVNFKKENNLLTKFEYYETFKQNIDNINSLIGLFLGLFLIFSEFKYIREKILLEDNYFNIKLIFVYLIFSFGVAKILSFLVDILSFIFGKEYNKYVNLQRTKYLHSLEYSDKARYDFDYFSALNTFDQYDVDFDKNKFIRDEIFNNPNIRLDFDGLQYNKLYFNNNKLEYKQLSDGLKKILSLTVAIYASEKETILIDEIENCLHPDYQKLIPTIIQLVQEKKAKEGKKVQYFISTHSPFIIAEAAKYGNPESGNSQKVYLLEDGQTRDLKGNLGLGQEGYSGNACKEVVNEMLGVDTSDFLPSKIVFCEQSLCAFLQIVNARFYNKDLQFKTPMDKAGNDQGGDHFVIEIAELEKIIEKGAKNLLPTDFTIIMDIPNESHLRKKLENVRIKHPDKILTLTTMSFEEKFGQDPKAVAKQIGGKIQNAKDIAIAITKTDFETKFAEILKIFNN